MSHEHHGSVTGGPVMVWDHEDCPLDDCDGELQQQDKFNVMCLGCEAVWTHVKSGTKHYLQTEDFETVAEKPVAMTDGGNTSVEPLPILARDPCLWWWLDGRNR